MLNFLGNENNFVYNDNTLYTWIGKICYRIEKFADKIIISTRGKVIEIVTLN